jgi:hypothetical protein
MQPTFSQKIAKALIPSPVQTFIAISVGFVIVVAANIREIYALFGIDSTALNAVLDQYQHRTSGVLTTQLANQAALITFWAVVGVVAYLICWSFYNFMVEARNEVTLKTQYTNQGRSQGKLAAIGIKVVCAALLLASLYLLRSGFSMWLALAAPAFTDLNLFNIAAAVGAVLGLAAQLYLVLALAMATFTPWYRK